MAIKKSTNSKVETLHIYKCCIKRTDVNLFHLQMLQPVTCLSCHCSEIFSEQNYQLCQCYYILTATDI